MHHIEGEEMNFYIARNLVTQVFKYCAYSYQGPLGNIQNLQRVANLSFYAHLNTVKLESG
jgi:hypothetical protein